jgi:hypothetical protein
LPWRGVAEQKAEDVLEKPYDQEQDSKEEEILPLQWNGFPTKTIR